MFPGNAKRFRVSVPIIWDSLPAIFLLIPSSIHPRFLSGIPPGSFVEIYWDDLHDFFNKFAHYWSGNYGRTIKFFNKFDQGFPWRSPKKFPHHFIQGILLLKISLQNSMWKSSRNPERQFFWVILRSPWTPWGIIGETIGWIFEDIIKRNIIITGWFTLHMTFLRNF